jgi:HD-like signal output (HDOD) protein
MDSENMPDWFDMNSFWRAAARRAALARGLAQKLHPETQSESFTAGLLQDMAVPVITMRKNTNYQKLYEQWNLVEDETNLVELEKSNLDLDHANIGAQMAKHWGFPVNLIEMINSHHATINSPGVPLSVQIVALLKGNPEIPLQEMALRIERIFNLDQTLFREIAMQAEEDAEELAEALR